MDFTLTDEQQAIAELAHRILSEQLPPERLRDLEQTEAWFADDVWAALGEADLLGVALPEADGGGGYGILEACLIAEQIGRTVAPVPYLSSIVASAMPVAALRRRGAAEAAPARCDRGRDDALLRAVRTDRRLGAGGADHPGHRRRCRVAPRRREVARDRRRPGRRHPRPRPHLRGTFRGVRGGTRRRWGAPHPGGGGERRAAVDSAARRRPRRQRRAASAMLSRAPRSSRGPATA